MLRGDCDTHELPAGKIELSHVQLKALSPEILQQETERVRVSAPSHPHAHCLCDTLNGQRLNGRNLKTVVPSPVKRNLRAKHLRVGNLHIPFLGDRALSGRSTLKQAPLYSPFVRRHGDNPGPFILKLIYGHFLEALRSSIHPYARWIGNIPAPSRLLRMGRKNQHPYTHHRYLLHLPLSPSSLN